MTADDLTRLATLLQMERDACISAWRKQVRELPSARHLDAPTLNDHMPGLLDELISALESHSELTIPEAYEEGSATAHGIQRVRDFDHAIGVALQTYATQRAQETLQRREEYLAFVAHDLRTPLNAISLAGRVREQAIAPRESSSEATHAPSTTFARCR